MDIIITITIILVILFTISISRRTTIIKDYKPTETGNPPIETYIATAKYLQKHDQEEKEIKHLKEIEYGHDFNHFSERCIHCNVYRHDLDVFKIEDTLICTKLTGANKPMTYKEIRTERFLNGNI